MSTDAFVRSLEPEVLMIQARMFRLIEPIDPLPYCRYVNWHMKHAGPDAPVPELLMSRKLSLAELTDELSPPAD